jgi:hypothetical protein
MKALTIILGVLVVLSSVLVYRGGANDVSTPFGKDEGSVIGSEKAEPKDVAKISVATWDDQAGKAAVFQVQKKGEGWIIPSHFGYPADAGDRVGRTAGVLKVKRGRFVTDEAERHDELGVVDPTSAQAEKAKNRGRKITIEDAGGAKLIDIIVGKPDEAGGGYFVREADSSAVFTAQLTVDISTRFIDWVKPDLLQIKAEDVRAISIHDYSVDENQAAIVTRSETRVAREKADADWTSPQVPATKRVAKGQVDKFLGELTGLRLVGIRPFDPAWLESRGFFLNPDPAALTRPDALVLDIGQGRKATLAGNEGETTVTTRKGITYHLYFGEIALGDDEDTAAGSKKKEAKPAEPEKKDGEAKPGEAKPDAGKADAAHNRYLVVFASYDPAQDEEAKAASATAAANAKEGAPKADPGKANKALADKANKRFQAFFYVIANTAFDSLRPKEGSLWEDKPAEPMAGNTGKTIKQWLAENGAKPGITTTPSGLQYEVLSRGAEGGKQPTDADQVEVRYKGTLVDGTEFDSSKEGTASFGVTGVIKGWTEALKLMHEGDKWRLFVPPELAYGDKAQGDKITPNSLLIFEVELVKVK